MTCDQQTKRCSKCGEVKPATEFRRSKSLRRRHGRVCLGCFRFCEEAKGRQAAVRRAYDRAYYRTRIGARLTYAAKYRSPNRGYDFNLDPADIQRRVDAGVCELTGLAFDLTATDKGPFRPSLDRIDATKGYTTDNVRVVLWCVNAMCGTWGLEAVLPVIRALAERFPDGLQTGVKVARREAAVSQTDCRTDA